LLFGRIIPITSAATFVDHSSSSVVDSKNGDVPLQTHSLTIGILHSFYLFLFNGLNLMTSPVLQRCIACSSTNGIATNNMMTIAIEHFQLHVVKNSEPGDDERLIGWYKLRNHSILLPSLRERHFHTLLQQTVHQHYRSSTVAATLRSGDQQQLSSSLPPIPLIFGLLATPMAAQRELTNNNKNDGKSSSMYDDVNGEGEQSSPSSSTPLSSSPAPTSSPSILTFDHQFYQMNDEHEMIPLELGIPNLSQGSRLEYAQFVGASPLPSLFKGKDGSIIGTASSNPYERAAAASSISGDDMGSTRKPPSYIIQTERLVEATLTQLHQLSNECSTSAATVARLIAEQHALLRGSGSAGSTHQRVINLDDDGNGDVEMDKESAAVIAAIHISDNKNNDESRATKTPNRAFDDIYDDDDTQPHQQQPNHHSSVASSHDHRHHDPEATLPHDIDDIPSGGPSGQVSVAMTPTRAAKGVAIDPDSTLNYDESPELTSTPNHRMPSALLADTLPQMDSPFASSSSTSPRVLSSATPLIRLSSQQPFAASSSIVTPLSHRSIKASSTLSVAAKATTIRARSKAAATLAETQPAPAVAGGIDDNTYPYEDNNEPQQHLDAHKTQLQTVALGSPEYD
jgi:hypothetical protein